MKLLIVLSVVAFAAGDISHVLSDEHSAPVLRSDFDIAPDGAFVYAYETANGISAQAQGSLKSDGSEYPYVEVKGAYKYTAPDGQPIELSYTANENGYQPSGSHLPTPPPLPDYIARSLQYIAEHPPQVESSGNRASNPAIAALLG